MTDHKQGVARYTSDGNRDNLGGATLLDALARAEQKKNAETSKKAQGQKKAELDPRRPVTEKELANLPLQADALREIDFRIDDTLRRLKNVQDEVKEVSQKKRDLDTSVKNLSGTSEPRLLRKVKELQDQSRKIADYLAKLAGYEAGFNRIVASAREQREKWVAEYGPRFNYLLEVQAALEGKPMQSGSQMKRFDNEGDVGQSQPGKAL